MNKLIYILFAILLFSCGEDSNPTDKNDDNKTDIDTVEYSLAVIYDNQNDPKINESIKKTIEFGINDPVITKMQGYTYFQINLEEYQVEPENGLGDIVNNLNKDDMHCIISTSLAVTQLLEQSQVDEYVLDISTKMDHVNNFKTYYIMPQINKEAAAIIGHLYKKGYRYLSYIVDDSDYADEMKVRIRKETVFINVDNGKTYEIDGEQISNLWENAASLNVYLEEEVPADERDEQAVVILTQKDFSEFLLEMNAFEFTNNVGFYTYSVNTFDDSIFENNTASDFASNYNLYFPIVSNSAMKNSVKEKLLNNIDTDLKYSPYIFTSYDALYVVYSTYSNILLNNSTGNNTDFETEFEILFTQQPAEGVMGSLLMTNRLRDYGYFDFYNIKGSNNSYSWEFETKFEVIPN